MIPTGACVAAAAASAPRARAGIRHRWAPSHRV